MDNWLNLGIDGGGDWPKQEEKIFFGGYELLLKPATKETEQSIHINLSQKISQVDAITLVNRFLSILSWCNGGSKGMDIIYTVSTGPATPASIPIRPRITGSSWVFPFNRGIPKDPKARLALALYREGLVTDSIPLSFLSFFKIINIFYNDNELIEGLRSLLPHIKDELAHKRLHELEKTISDIPHYLYKRRCAIAHAFTSPTIDPDNASESLDLSQDMWLLDW